MTDFDPQRSELTAERRDEPFQRTDNSALHAVERRPKRRHDAGGKKQNTALELANGREECLRDGNRVQDLGIKRIGPEFR